MATEALSTGLPGLDRVLGGMTDGDNVVWQVDDVDDYEPFVRPLCKHAVAHGTRVVYFRFADHRPLLTEDAGAEIRRLQPERGFEPFLAEVHRTVNKAGRGSVFVFDCLSELAPDWCSDRMLGNFFMLSCPYIYEHGSLAYFATLRNHHSFHALRPISNTAQVLVDVYRCGEKRFIHPIKVEHRHSGTMYMLHAWEGNEFVPVTQSYIITEVLSDIPWSRLDSASTMLGYWSSTFARAEKIQTDLEHGLDRQEDADEYFLRLLRMLISHDERVLGLAKEYLTLKDILDIRRRMIGTGLIGGKAVGMLLARAIMEKRLPKWGRILESHDSFYIGADVFYTYLVQNKCWWAVQERKAGPLPGQAMERLRNTLLTGEFPVYIVQQFADMLDYFGQAPIIVRSSSLLEDNYGNAFAGKYESVFCANQAGRRERLDKFLSAVRFVYASTMSDMALAYREKRGLLQKDEQMGLLIQRVSGAAYGDYFFPQGAGVGFSFNPYVWHESIDPKAGMVRLVFGVGTRAVNRSDDDYTRVVALNAPERRPEANFEEVRQYAQRRVDVLDLKSNRLVSLAFDRLGAAAKLEPLEMFASRDRRQERRAKQQGRTTSGFPWVLTFDRLLKDTDFVADMREMLRTLQEAYDTPVDVEFAVNFFDGRDYRINLLQCRPLQVRAPDMALALPENVRAEETVFRSEGAVLGQSMQVDVDWFVYVHPDAYAKLPDRERHAVARAIGDVTAHDTVREGCIVLVGPGRWGTTTPALGVPVDFDEISPVRVLCEIGSMHEALVPDFSLGTHFFNELVENNMLYLALSPDKDGESIRRKFFEEDAGNRLAELCPRHQALQHVVRVLDVRGQRIRLHADTMKHRVVCYRRAAS